MFKKLLIISVWVAASFAHQQTVNAEFHGRVSNTQAEATTDDVRAEIQFGRELAARVLGRYKLYENKELAKYVSLVGASVAQFANRPELEFHFAVLKTDSINAFAAPGGYVFITKGAIMNMQDESELAAVLAHEIGHIAGKHIVKELNIKSAEDSPVSSFSRFLGGSGDPAKAAFLSMVDKASSILFETGYKMEDEREADSNAVLYLAFSGYDPQALSRYLQKIKAIKGENTSVLNKTHPSFDDRIGLVSGVIDNEGLNSGSYNTGKERFSDFKSKI